jgi:hypothetical protein
MMQGISPVVGYSFQSDIRQLAKAECETLGQRREKLKPANMEFGFAHSPFRFSGCENPIVLTKSCTNPGSVCAS